MISIFVHTSVGAGTTRAPGTGPLAIRTVRQTPAPESWVPTSIAAAAEVHRNAHVGPEPDTMPASAPASAVPPSDPPAAEANGQLIVALAIVAAMVSRDPGMADTAGLAAAFLLAPVKPKKPKRASDAPAQLMAV